MNENLATQSLNKRSRLENLFAYFLSKHNHRMQPYLHRQFDKRRQLQEPDSILGMKHSSTLF